MGSAVYDWEDNLSFYLGKSLTCVLLKYIIYFWVNWAGGGTQSTQHKRFILNMTIVDAFFLRPAIFLIASFLLFIYLISIFTPTLILIASFFLILFFCKNSRVCCKL